MSVQVTICCDDCSTILAGAKTASAARKSLRGDGHWLALPGGRDICKRCVVIRTGQFIIDKEIEALKAAQR